MPFLQKQFRGIQSLLGEFSGGNLGFDISGLIQPVFDVTQYAEPLRVVEDSGSLVAAGQQLTEIVPDDELWLVKWITIKTSTLTGVTAGTEAVPALRMQQGVSMYPLTRRSTIASANGEVDAVSWDAGSGYLPVYGGGAVGGLCTRYNGTGSPTFLIQTAYHRLTV